MAATVQRLQTFSAAMDFPKAHATREQMIAAAAENLPSTAQP